MLRVDASCTRAAQHTQGYISLYFIKINIYSFAPSVRCPFPFLIPLPFLGYVRFREKSSSSSSSSIRLLPPSSSRFHLLHRIVRRRSQPPNACGLPPSINVLRASGRGRGDPDGSTTISFPSSLSSDRRRRLTSSSAVAAAPPVGMIRCRRHGRRLRGRSWT